MKKGNFLNATMIWGDMEEAVLKVADDVVSANHCSFLFLSAKLGCSKL